MIEIAFSLHKSFRNHQRFYALIIENNIMLNIKNRISQRSV